MTCEQAAWAVAWWAVAVILWCVAMACIVALVAATVMTFGKPDEKKVVQP